MIVVTGAAGMIGSALVRHLNDLGKDQLLLVDDLKEQDKWKNLVGKGFEDLISKHALFDWLEGKQSDIEAIIHLGACSSTVESNADYLLENNFRYTIRLAKWALHHNKRFIYASSAATYGDGQLGFDDQEEGLSKLKPLNMYGFSKHLVDLWMLRHKVFDRVVALKYFNVFGPNEYHKGRMASMVYKMMQKQIAKEPISLFKSTDPNYEDGGQMRDFIYVKDAVKMSCAFLDPTYFEVGGVYNIGSGRPSTWNLLAESFFKALKKKKEIGYIDMPIDLVSQYQNYTSARMDKFQKVFQKHPHYLTSYPIEKAVEDYVQNYLISEARW